jgi:hypothetical protein
MKSIAILTAFLLSLFLAACATEWGYKLPTGSEKFTAVPAEQVEILFGPPNRPFKQIGIVSVLGGAFSSDVAMYKKLRKAAKSAAAFPRTAGYPRVLPEYQAPVFFSFRHRLVPIS